MLNPESIKIAVTGASGFVGNHLVDYLSNKSYKIVAISRSLKGYEKPKNNVEVIKADILKKNEMQKAIKDCQIIVHNAGIIDPYGKKSVLLNTNADATEQLLHIAEKEGIQHFIHMSSLSVITGIQDCYNIDETMPPQKTNEAYASSKILAEKYVNDFAKNSTMKTTILRPGFIYGLGENSWMARLVNSLRNNQVMIIGDGSKETNLINVTNLCYAVELCLLNEKAYGQTYNLTDGIKVSKKELLDTFCEVLNLPKVKKSVNPKLAFYVCMIVNALSPLLSKSAKIKLSRLSLPAYRLMGVNQGFSIDKARTELNYRSIVDFKESIRKALQPYYED